MPIYLGSAGKVLLAQMDENERDILLRAIDMVPRTPNTIVDREILKKELEKILRQGYATSFGESFSGGAGISVPVQNYVCPVALCISGPEFRFNPEDYFEEMKTSAERISHTLAFYYKRPGREGNQTNRENRRNSTY